MVKGAQRRVIFVKAPSERYFEQAIFLLKEDALRESEDPEEILRAAQQAADRYLREKAVKGRTARFLRSGGLFLLGAALASGLWWGLPLLGNWLF